MSSSSSASDIIIPRAAVSTLVRYTTTSTSNDFSLATAPKYLLIQRGKAPSAGMWSLPGGKLEYGETTLAGAMRELAEETIWPDGVDALRWYEAPMCTSDAIGDGYHYLIAQCFASLICDAPPSLAPADDAADAAWFTYQEIVQKRKRHESTEGVLKVIDRAERLLAAGLLPTNIVAAPPS